MPETIVGVVLNLTVWFATHVLVPLPGSFCWFAAGLAAVGFIGLQRLKWGVMPAILGSAVAGLAVR